MKKIYMLTAVLALLTLSLNAQSQTTKKWVRNTASVKAPSIKAAATNTYEMVTNPSTQLVEGKQYILVSGNYAMGALSATGTSGGFGTAVTITNNGDGTVTVPADASPMVLTLHNYSSTYTSGYTFSLENGSYLRPYRSSGNNATNLTTSTTANDNCCWGTVADVKSTGGYGVMWNYLSTTRALAFRESSSVSARFAYYATSNLTAASTEYFYALIYVAKEEETPVHDLGIALSATASVSAGNAATVTATVTNNGGYDENGYTVTIYANGTAISTQTGTSLAQGASATFTAQYATTDADAGTTVNFTATVTCTDDADATNNNATASTSVINLPPPTNVAATAEGTTATVTWNEPNIPGVNVTEDFEDTSRFPSFSLGGITATEHYGEVGGWTLYDSTGARVWGSESDDFDNEGEPQAWMVFNATSVGVAAYSGVQFMESICPLTLAASPADSWLISPKLSGNAQTITFYERALSQSYGNETYEVLASSTDNNPASFTKVAEFTDNTLTWTQRSADLPAGTKYFAICHTSNDIFGICVDDVTYEAAGEPQPISYNIYLDGELVGNVDANTFSYDFSNISVGDHECAVSAVYEGGESALVPATFSTLPKTATPTINVVTNADGSKTISATGDGTVHLYIDGVEQNNPYTIMPSIDGDITVTVTATAQEEGKLVSDPATQTVTVAEAGRSPMPTITWTDNGDGSYTVTVVGTGEVNLYINDPEHGGTTGDPVATGQGRVSITVEQHSQAMTLPVQATNQEDGLAVSRTAEATYSIPAMSLDGFTALDPQPANSSAPIDMSNLMFVDRFSKVIPATNDHPFLYDYYLQENQVRQRTSNSVDVPVKHTGSDGLGFYSLNQIDNDVNIGIDHDKGLEMDVRNAAMELPLEADPGIYFYTVQRGTADAPNQADRKLLGVLQRTTDGNYSETLNPSYDYEAVYPGGQHHIHLDTDTVPGEYNNYLAYVPIVWTMGFDRVNYETDHTHNSYGAPRWKTGVADVRIENLNAERQNGYMGSTNWMDGTDSVSMYMLTLDAIGTMPTVNTMPYEPYMFRVFVESKNGKLRGYKHVGEDVYNDGSHFEGDGTGPLTGPICVWSEYVKGSDRIGVNGLEYTFHKEKESQYNDPEHPDHWIAPDEANIMFAALNKLETEGEGELKHIMTDELNVYVRFYYIVAGSADNHVPGGNRSMALRADGDGEAPAPGEGDAPAGYGTESPGTPPNPTTSVKEMRYHGEVVSTTYVNAQGMQSDKPFKGVNIVVTRYTDGTTSTTKVVR